MPQAFGEDDGLCKNNDNLRMRNLCVEWLLMHDITGEVDLVRLVRTFER